MPVWLIILNTGFIVVIAPSCGYLLHKAIRNDKELAVFREKYKENMKTVAIAFKQITQRCRDRTTWIQGILNTVTRMDKNLAVIGDRVGAQVDKSNPGDTVRGIQAGCSAPDDFDGIENIEEKFEL